MNYYEHHIGDYIKDAAHLTMLEDASYRRLIDAYYTREGPLPADKKECQRLARSRTKGECVAVDLVLDEFFDLREDGWHQKRCDEEIARFQDKSRKAKQSADVRWGKSQCEGNANADANAMRTHSEGNAYPVTSNHTPITKGQKLLSGKPALKTLTDLGIDEQIAKDWMVVRKAKRAPITDTALDELKLEASKAGITVPEAVAICAKRSWQGFKASWNWQEELPTPLASNIKRAAI